MVLSVRGQDPFRDLENMAADMRKSMLQTFNQNGRGVVMPLADVYEEDNTYVVEMHIAGMSEEELDVEVEHGLLTVKGEHHETDEKKDKRNYVLRENSTSIYRSFGLPKHADVENITAHLKEGVLRIEVPIEPQKKPRKVTVAKKR